jgi:hypothetical protein
MENQLLKNTNYFLCDDTVSISDDLISKFNNIKNNFFGDVITSDSELNKHIDEDNVHLYFYGILKKDMLTLYPCINKLFLVKELSDNLLCDDTIQIINMGQIPLNVHNVGVMFNNLFDNERHYFKELDSSHQFQALTESNKPGVSYRKGIYLSNICEKEDGKYFNLLRCSTNLDGPTEKFNDVDKDIINTINNVSPVVFEQHIEINHVLAQIYNNYVIDGKERKARIANHSDKTKDMPIHGIMAFCTFYDFGEIDMDKLNIPEEDNYDLCYKNLSVFTKIKFILKKDVDDPLLVKQFFVTLYPNSAFMISLTTNRLYTHEICPSSAPFNTIPTRLGYVMRCSDTVAKFTNNETHIFNKENNEFEVLKPQHKEGVKKLKENYRFENFTTDQIEYGHVDFSLNEGDYLEPLM